MPFSNQTLLTFDFENLRIDVNGSEVVNYKHETNENGTCIPMETGVFFFLIMENDGLEFKFEKFNNSNLYNLTYLTYLNSKGENVSLQIDLKHKNGFELDKARYFCNEINFKSSNGLVELKIHKLEFAMATKADTKFDDLTKISCPIEPGSSAVPIAVGCTLLVVMAVSLGIYIFMRNRS